MTAAPHCRLADIGRHVGQEVAVSCWLFNLRSKGRIHFLQLRDGSARVQAVAVAGACDDATFAALGGLKMEASLNVQGEVRPDDRAPGGFELGIRSVTVLQNPSEDFPISKKEHGIDFLLENRHLWLRSRKQEALLKVRSAAIWALREFFQQRNFTLVDTPILTGSIGENAGTLFSLSYFDLGEAYLAQTGQLYLEAACMALGNVYNLGPTFRAEKSKTRRHLTEFWMLEAEMAFHDNDASMAVQEQMVCHLVQAVLERCPQELAVLERDTAPLTGITPPFPRLDYDEAISWLQSQGSEIRWGADLGADEETQLASRDQNPVFITNYPKEVKAFYMKEHPARPEKVLCADLLAPEGYGEIVGGSQREDDYDKLLARIRAQGLPEDSYDWYLDLRRYGSVVHAGFGIGIERTLAWITGIHHVREAIPFPRTLARISP